MTTQLDEDLILDISWQMENYDVDISSLLRNLFNFQVIGLFDIVGLLVLYFQFNQLTFGLYLNILVKQLMYTLYHHFLQKVKQEQVQRYNKKHRAYLIRSGKLQIQQDQNIRHERPKYQNQRNRNRQNMRDIPKKPQSIKKNEQVPAIVQAKPKRQRQFNRPGKNPQNNNQKLHTKEQNINIKQNDEEIPIKPAKTNDRAQNFAQQPEVKKPTNYEEDRPIKKNKLTPQQMQYLNEAKSNPIPQISKPLNNNQNRVSLPSPSLQSTTFQAPVQPPNNKNERPINQNKVNLSELQQYEEVQLVQCPTCGRKFRPKAFQKHENVCQKVFQQKRKPFEVKATDEQAQLLKKKSKITNKNEKSEAEKKQAKQAKWKRQSQTFQNMIKRGRGQKVEVVEEDLRIECPGCGRKFDEKAASRHIQFCTKKKKKK